MHFTLSQRAGKMSSSAIRELLKITADPSIISFAGGLPAPQTFPIEVMHAACERVFADDPRAAFQYAPTEGYAPLREWVGARHGVPVERVLITTGSQQALDLIGKIFIDPDSAVLVESPTYLGALQAFAMFEPRFVELPCDDAGMVPELMTAQMTAGARFVYAMPNFQNPTGRRMPLARRLALIETMRAAGVPIIEDDPYGELSYSGEQLPSLLSMHPDGVIHMGSFSKIMAPGLRLGYVIAPAAIMDKLVQAKQASDLHTPGFNQRVAFEAIKSGFLDGHIATIRALYARQCAAMLAALADNMPASVRWNEPEGGMFIWLRLPEGVDSAQLLRATLAPDSGPRVAFVHGAPFYAGPADQRSARLSFVTVTPARIDEGIAQLARALDHATAVHQRRA
ncbi:PLP-dependent aminotransferase family protein [Oxalobacteraceae bacterium]|nr:PLP-dependent aminotransferase family protein [Oxalobacteraceae bacterium]